MEPPGVTSIPAAAEPRLTRRGSAPTPKEFPLYYKVRRRKWLRAAWRVVYDNGTTSKSQDTRNDVKLFSFHAEQSIERLSRQLRQSKFQFPPSEGILQNRPGKRPRPIVKSPIDSRIVQRALLDVLQDEPGIKPYYKNPTSFGGIKGEGLGVPGTIAGVYTAILDGRSHYIRSDIEGFFTAIPRKLVLEKIKAVITDSMFNELLERATITELENLASLGQNTTYFPLYEIGVAQGCCLSPLLGNILLEDFDKEMNGRGIVCIRYIDDFVILGPKESHVIAAFKSAQRILSKYGLNAYDPLVNKEKAEMGEVKHGLQFLGSDIRPGLITPSRKSTKRLIDSLSLIIEKSKKLMANPVELARKKRTVAGTLKEMDNVVKGWGNQYSFCNNNDVMTHLDEQITELTKHYFHFARKAKQSFRAEEYSANWRRLIGVHLLTDSKYDPIIHP